MPLLTFPLALIALTALPAVAAIYYLRSRHRRVVVSSLLLWSQQQEARAGGTRWEKWQTPLLLLLELLAVALLVLAAAGPRVKRAVQPPVVVVLDDSLSLRAQAPTGGPSARSAGFDAVAQLLQSERGAAVHLVLAGAQPRVLASDDRGERAAELLAALRDWRCAAPRADLDAALQLAAEVGGSRGRLVVITDHPAPDGFGQQQRRQWWAVGTPHENVGITHALRSTTAAGDRVLLEVTNFSALPTRTRLDVSGGTPLTIDLDPRATRRLVLDADPRADFTATLPLDALPDDNTVTLLPARRPPVRVALQFDDARKGDLVRRALSVTGLAELGAGGDLLVSDRGDAAAVAGPWVVQVVDAGEQSAAFAGPFVVDRDHPLAQGVGLEGVAWGRGVEGEPGGEGAKGAGEEAHGVTPWASAAGDVVIGAGDVPLVSDLQRVGGGRRVTVWWRPRVSTWQDTPAFVALWWNLLEWRARTLPGVVTPNVRLGEALRAIVAGPLQRVTVTRPDGTTVDAPVAAGELALPAEMTGEYRFRAGDGSLQRVAVNALAYDEGDLSAAASGRWGTWIDEAALEREYRGVLWAAALAALAVLGVHGWLVSRGGNA